MTAPEVRYCTTEDGVRIAYAISGDGPALLALPTSFESFTLTHKIPEWGAFHTRLSAGYTRIDYDPRGVGLSQREIGEISLDAQVLDIEAVVRACKLKTVSIWAYGASSARALVYASRHPSQVRSLVLYGAYAQASRVYEKETRALIDLARLNWPMAARAMAAAGDSYNTAVAQTTERWVHAMLQSTSGEFAASLMELQLKADATECLPLVNAPSLVLHRRHDRYVPFSAGQQLAAMLPNARFIPLDGSLSDPSYGDSDAVLDAARAFLAETSGERKRRTSKNAPASAELSPVQVVLATDTVDATIVPRAEGEAQSFASGRYAVVRPLGAGGQKSVFLVHDNALDRDCALALIRNEDLEPDDLLRFQREAQAMARLGAHSNIVSVFDIGEQDGRPFLVSEYIAGGDLRQLLLKRGRLPLAEALAVGGDIARALAVAHARGVVHRDVKPLNIWLTEDGAAKLGDFGLAFSLDRSRLTMPGTVMGSAAYLAPEQALGEPVTERSDLYALGCLLYEMVCGRPPFADANPTAVIAQHLNAAPAAPSSHEPDLPPALEDLILRLLAKSPGQRPESASAVLEELRRIGDNATALTSTTASPAPSPGAEDADAGAFVGRGAELERLEAALERTIGGGGSLVMLVGEPGIGKTRLLDRVAAIARTRGIHVLSGHCYDGDWAPPFSPFVEAIKQHAATAPSQRLAEQLGADAGVLARIVPVLRERLPQIEEPPQIPAEGERYRLLEATSDFFERIAASAPVVLMLDDLHWADKGTIAMLQQVARTSATQRMLVLGAYRDVELDRTRPLSDALAGLRREKSFERIALRGLDGAEVAELLDAIAEQDVPAALSEAIARETAGNPFFIKEVLLHLVEEGKIVQSDGAWTSKLSIAEMGIPEGVREVIGRRLSRVSETCNRMLTVASALTAGFSWDALKAINGVISGDAGVGASLAAPAGEASPAATRETATEAQLLDALDEALGAQLIVERERGRYDFTHALIRHTLYEELSTPRRVLLHRQIGEALERLYATDLEGHVTELAHHFYELAHHYEQGEDWPKALQFLMKAGEKAASSYANQDAISFFDRAYQAGQRAGSGGSEALSNAAFQRGTVRATIGDLSAADDDFALAASLAREAGDREAEAGALAERGFVLINAHEFEQAEATLNQALSIATAHGLQAEYVVRTYLMELFSDWGRLRERDEQFAATEGMSGGANHHRARAFRAALVLFSAYWDGRFDVAISGHKAAAPHYEAAHDFFARIAGVWANALAVAHAGHYEDALSAFAHVTAEGERCGDIFYPMRTLNCIGWVYGEIENHERALEQNLRSVEAAIAVDLPDPEVEMNARLNAADNLIALGRLDEAADQLRHVERVVRDPLPPERWMLWRYSQHYYHTQGELQLMQGDAETALMLAERCLALAEETKARKNIVKARRLRAQARMALGDLAAAENDIGAALELAIEITNPGQLWKTHEALGDLRRAERRAEDARSAHGDALAVLQQMAASLANDELRDTLLKSAAVRRLQERTSS